MVIWNTGILFLFWDKLSLELLKKDQKLTDLTYEITHQRSR
jgi:hypothetical protein